MHTLKGTLVFNGNWNSGPWLLMQANGSEVDLYPLITQMLLDNNGRPARQEFKQVTETYQLILGPESKLLIDYRPQRSAVLEYKGGDAQVHKDGFSGVTMVNLAIYLPKALTFLSGRLIDFTIDENGLTIAPDPSEEVFRLEYSELERSFPIPKGKENTLCGMGTDRCCIFMTLGKQSFACQKFNSNTGTLLLSRRAMRQMNVNRIGSCSLVNAEEEMAA